MITDDKIKQEAEERYPLHLERQWVYIVAATSMRDRYEQENKELREWLAAYKDSLQKAGKEIMDLHFENKSLKQTKD